MSSESISVKCFTWTPVPEQHEEQEQEQEQDEDELCLVGTFIAADRAVENFVLGAEPVVKSSHHD